MIVGIGRMAWEVLRAAPEIILPLSFLGFCGIFMVAEVIVNRLNMRKRRK